MRRQALTAAALVFLLLSPGTRCFATSSLSATSRADVTPGVLTMVATNLPETKQEAGTLEIALEVKAGSCIQTAAMVLEYDYSKIHPIAWDTAQTPVPIPDLSADISEDAAWKEAAVLESRSPGSICGKPALSFRRGNRAYLYMAAESWAATPLEGDTLAMSMRFGYTPGAVPSKDYVASAVNFAEDREGKKVAFASPVKGSVLYQSKDPNTGETQFFYHMPLEKTQSGLVRENMNIPAAQRIDAGIYNFTYLPAGRSAGERAATAADFVSLTFYDWDDTLLGTRIVAKETGWLIDPNTVENRPQYVNADGTAKYTDEQLASMKVAPLVPEGNVLIGGLDQNGVTVSAINKAGYSYAGWVDYSGSSTPDVGIEVPAGQTIEGMGQIVIPLCDLTENVTLRAAYDEKLISSLKKERRYEISISPFQEHRDGAYLETIVTVKRTKMTRRVENEMDLIINLRPYGLGETQVVVSLPSSDLEMYKLLLPINASETYNKANGVSFTLFDANEGIIANTILVKAADMKNHNMQ